MQVGDQVKLVGTVKEMVTDKGTARVSVLLGTVDAPGNPSHEYWAQASDLVADTPAAAAAAAPATSETETAATETEKPARRSSHT